MMSSLALVVRRDDNFQLQVTVDVRGVADVAVWVPGGSDGLGGRVVREQAERRGGLPAAGTGSSRAMMLRSLVAGGQLDAVGAISSRRLVTRERLREVLRRGQGAAQDHSVLDGHAGALTQILGHRMSRIA